MRKRSRLWKIRQIVRLLKKKKRLNRATKPLLSLNLSRSFRGRDPGAGRSDSGRGGDGSAGDRRPDGRQRNHRRSIVLLNRPATAEPTSTIATGHETVGDGVTGARDLHRANDQTAPSAFRR